MFRRFFLMTALPVLFPLIACAQPPAPAAVAENPIPADSPTAAHEVDHRFWIVSSRRASQKRDRIGCGPLDVWTADCSQCFSNCSPRHISIPTVRSPLGEKEFQHALTPGVPVCIVIHGSYVEWDRADDYSWKAYRWLKQARPHEPLHVIAFSWPSDPLTFVPNIDFNVLGKRAALNAFYLARLLQQIPPESPVSFFAHSQGTRSVTALLHLLAGGTVQGYQLPAGTDRGHRIRVVLAAAAVDHDWLNPGNLYGRALCRTEAVLNLVNQHDWALGFYHLRSLNSKHAVGRSGFRHSDYQCMGPLAYRIHQMDVTREIGTGHNLQRYLSRNDLAAAIAPYHYFSNQQNTPARILAPPSDVQPTRYAGEETRQRAVNR
ncbi:MAG: alpha/beta hydrolase [Planctomycetaceae bacterium]|nr:alpha/beta hydrolase [Planctomycetaceae bacterium]